MSNLYQGHQESESSIIDLLLTNEESSIYLENKITDDELIAINIPSKNFRGFLHKQEFYQISNKNRLEIWGKIPSNLSSYAKDITPDRRFVFNGESEEMLNEFKKKKYFVIKCQKPFI